MSKRIGVTLVAGLLVNALSGWAQSSSPAAPPAPAGSAAPAAAVPDAKAAPAAPAPKLVPIEPIRDVGQVPKGEKVKVDFELRNDGPVELLISDVRPTCGCTVASFDAKIAPGGTGRIHAEVETNDFSGPIAKTITVLSNDPVQPRVTLTVKARVDPQIVANPGYARFVYVRNQAPATVKQWLWSENFADLKVLSVKSPYKFIQAKFRPATGEELRPGMNGSGQWIVETTIQPDAEVGALRDYLVVETNHPKQKELRLAITGFVRPLLQVTPMVAEFGALDLGAGSQDLSLVLINFGDPIEIRGVNASVPGVESKIKVIEEGRRWEIKMTLTGKMPKGHTDATLTIDTTSPQQATVQVPLRGTVN